MVAIFVAALVSLMSGASAQAQVPGSCCGPRRNTATMLEYGGTYVIQSMATKAESNMIKMNYDFDRRMQHLMIHSTDLNTGKETNTTVLSDYKNAKTYALAADGHCYVQYLNPDLLIDPCGSPNFTTLGQYKVGSPSSPITNQVRDMYGKYEMAITITADDSNFTTLGQYKVGSPSSPITVNQVSGMYGNYEMAITITADDCMPVTQTLYGYSEDKSSTGLYAFMYTDIQNKVVDDSLFTVPLACSAPVSVPIGKRHLEDIVGRPLPVPF